MKDQNPFKQKLYGHTLPVKEDMWTLVEASLPEKRRRFPFLWLALSGFILLGASVTGLAIKHQLVHQKVTQELNLIEESISSNTTRVIENKEPIAYTETISRGSIPEHKKSIQSIQKIQHNKLSRNTSIPNSTEPTNEGSLLFGNEMRVAHALNGRIVTDATDELQLLNISGLTWENENITMSKIKPDPSCYKFKGKNGKNVLSVDVFGGPGMAPRNFESTDSETALYADARDKTEKSQYAWGAGARINLNLQRGFAVRLGILYDQIGDKFDYRDPSSYMTSMRIDSFFASNGTFLYSDTVNVLVFGTLIKKIHNRYTHLDIPLLVSYELPMGRATLMLNVGPVLNLKSSVRGQILDPTLNPVHLTQGTPDELKAYKNNLGLSIYLGAGALFPLTDNVSALIEPRFLYRINPVTLDTYPLKEHRSFAGLNLGIRYHFN
ncbi:MAG: hypothetical protein ABIQ02_00535 [Saprospiraceae bacterium]